MRAVRALRCAFVPRLWRALRRAAALEVAFFLPADRVEGVLSEWVPEDLVEGAAESPVPCP